MQIFIRTGSGRIFAVDVEPEMTIAELKKRIEARYKIPMAEMDILFRGCALKDAETIDEAEIKQEDLLNILKAPEKKSEGIKLLVKSDYGIFSTMVFKLSDTIKEVITKTCAESGGGDPESAKIYYRGQRLEEHITIKEANLKENDILILMFILRGC